MKKGILQRIERRAGVPGLADALASRLRASELTSLLLEVFRRRAGARSPARVLSDYRRDRFLCPSNADPRILAAWEKILHATMDPTFVPITLSPLAPLGTVAAVTATSQNRIVSTARGTEVVSDVTNQLALECACRRQGGEKEVHLLAGQRHVRAQPLPDPKMFGHFLLHGLVSSARDRGSRRFELKALRLHLDLYLSALAAFAGPETQIRITLTDLESHEARAFWREQLVAPLATAYPSVDFRFDPERTRGRGYYRELCFFLHAIPPGGEALELGDGGFVDWGAKLLADGKERMLTSAIGSERLCQFLAPGAAV